MKYEKVSKEELVKKIQVFERELKGYVDRVDQRYKIFFERNLAGMYRSRVNGEIVECNDALAQILGYKSKEDLIGTDAHILYSDVNDRKKHLELIRKNKFVRNRKLELLRKDGSQIWVSISTSEISHPATGKVEYLEGTIIDITELIHTQELLAQSENNFRSMMEQSPYGIIIHQNGNVKYANKRAGEIFNTSLGLTQNIKEIFPEQIFEEDSEPKEGILRYFDRVEIKTKEGAGFIDLYVKPVYFENSLMTELSFVDIRDRIKLEEEKIKTEVFKTLNDRLKLEIKEKEKMATQLKKSLHTNVQQAAKLEAIFENKSHVILTMDNEFRLTAFNTNFSDLMKSLYGITPRLFDKPLDDYTVLNAEERKLWKKKIRKVFGGKPDNFINHTSGAGGKHFYMQIFINPIYDEQKNVVEISGIGHDISDKVVAEHRLTESLKEKDILLKEIHHRVKNNLQVISSIFNLQSAFNQDERTARIFKESQNRIKSMAYIHESLYKSTHLGSIDFEEYLSRLGKNLIQSYTIRDLHVSLLMETEKVLLHLDQAIPCGLIVNEAISNSLKYAFDGRTSGIIMIYLKKTKNVVKMRITDDGIGLGDNDFLNDANTLGFHLIHTLAEQLRGTIKIDGKSGTSIVFEFPVQP